METEKRRPALVAARIFFFAVFLGLLVYASVRFAPPITRLLRDPASFKQFLERYGPISVLVFVLIQAAQIVIAVIPGEIVQIAGGYVFGTALGMLGSVAGAVLGTLVVFFATRLAGYPLVKLFVSPKKLARFDFLLNNPRSDITLFVLFLIPGIPKDALVYISGLTPVRPWRFLLISMVARLPGLLGSAYIGANLQEKDYLTVWILCGVALVLFVVGILAKDRVIERLHRMRGEGKDVPPEA
jgi:uncharacterized membrane protein YdjX (TVP38/TMEM64 family)